MCGICGFYDKNINEIDAKKLMENMLKIIEHRGPDNFSIFNYKNFILGHRRLSIIDLETGNQPIFNETKDIAIIFNGEIYNYLDLKKELENKGHIFSTRSDTEVLIHAYEEWGTTFFQNLNGIFSFAILDMSKNRLILVRDHFGVKPLHYYYKNNLLIFASEQKSILLHPKFPREISFDSLHIHLNLRYTQGNNTLFKDIKRLPPAHYAIFENDNLIINKYWELNYEIDYNITEKIAIEKINFLIKQAVKRQLMSDVPIGVYLSGGMDSSTIVQKMYELGVPEINTFTLGFNEPTDEFADAEKIAKLFKTNHHTLSLDHNPLKEFPTVIWHSEEPKINLLQGYNISKFVNSNKIKVVLGGLGGDELFAGYDIHKFIYPFNYFHKIIPAFMKKIFNFKSKIIFTLLNKSNILKFDEYRRGLQMLLALGDIERFYLILRNVWDYDDDFYKNIYTEEFLSIIKDKNKKVKNEFNLFFEKVEKNNALDQVLFVEFHTKMVNDYLLVEDRMSMANSVEERVPFLDIDLVKFAFTIPVNLKIKNNKTKYLFRKAMEDKLPKEIIYKKKWGFTANPYLQFKKDLKEVAEKILTENYIKKQGIFNYDYISKILNYPPHPRLRWHYSFLWIVVGLAIWEKMFISSDNFINKNFNISEYYS